MDLKYLGSYVFIMFLLGIVSVIDNVVFLVIYYFKNRKLKSTNDMAGRQLEYRRCSRSLKLKAIFYITLGIIIIGLFAENMLKIVLFPTAIYFAVRGLMLRKKPLDQEPLPQQNNLLNNQTIPSERALKAVTYAFVNFGAENQKQVMEVYGKGSGDQAVAISNWAMEHENDPAKLALLEANIERFKLSLDKQGG